MVPKPDQDRVKILLKDTITLLCKNGLSFKNTFSIDAVIGVTLDEDDVFLVALNEIIKSDNPLYPGIDDQDRFSDKDSQVHVSPRKKRKRQRKRGHHVKREGSDFSDGSSDECTQLAPQEHLQSSGKRQCIKDEREFSEEEIVFIKQELDETINISSVPRKDASIFPSENQVIASTINIDACNSMGESSWQPDAMPLQQQKPYTPSSVTLSSVPTATITSTFSIQGQKQVSPSQQTVQDSTQIPHKKNECDLCGRQFTTASNLKIHMNAHWGIYRYHCPFCDKGCTSTTVLKAHAAKHSAAKKFKCHLCPFQFDSGQEFDMHWNCVHS